MAIALVQNATEPNIAATTTHVSTFASSPTIGNIITCVATTDDAAGGTGCSIAGGGVTTWVQVQLENGFADTELWYGIVTSTGTKTVTVTDRHGSNFPAGNCIEWSGIDTTTPISVSGKTTSPSATSVTSSSLAYTAGQLFMAGTFPNGSIASPYTPATSSAPTTGWTAKQSGSTAGSVSFNVLAWQIMTGSGNADTVWTGVGGGGWDCVAAVFNPASAGTFTGGASASVTATATAAGFVNRNGGASASITASATAAGSTGLTGGASQTITATATAAGSTGLTGGASVTVTAGATAAGVVTISGGASAVETATATAAGTVATSSGATITVTAGPTAAGVVAFTGGASQTVTAGITAAGTVSTGAVGNATQTITATATAAGNVATFGVASQTVTAGITAAGHTNLTGGASSSVTATITAAGTVSNGPSGDASVTVTANITAAGIVSNGQFLFTPTQKTITVILAGRSLRYSYPVSFTVWKKNGVWFAEQTPATEILEAADVILAASGRPQIVNAALAAELATAGVGTITPI